MRDAFIRSMMWLTILLVGSPAAGAPAWRAVAVAPAPMSIEGEVAAWPERGNAGATSEHFALTDALPADVSVFVQVERPIAHLDALRSTPFVKWAESHLSAEAIGPVWRDLARAAGTSPENLARVCFGGRTTFAERRNPRGRTERMIVLTIESRELNRLLRALRPTVRAPRYDSARYELEDHQLHLARRGEQLFVAPVDQIALLDETLRNLSRRADRTLESHEAFTHREELPAGDVSVFLQHGSFIGGWSIATAELDGVRLRITQRSHYERPPFARAVTALEIDPAPLSAFEHDALLAMVEPLDIGETQLELFALAQLGEGLLSREMRRNLKDRRLLVIGEAEGRQEDPPTDLRIPTLVMCFEMKSRENAMEPFDRQMVRFINRLQSLGRDAFSLETPEVREFRQQAPRSIDLSPATIWLSDDLPLMRSVSLNWSIADGPHGSYYVIATHPNELRGTVSALEREGIQPGRLVQELQSAGFARGGRISHHLRSWAEQAELIAAPGQAEQVAEAASMLADLAVGLDRVRWRMKQPSRRDMRLELELTLSPPVTAEDECGPPKKK